MKRALAEDISNTLAMKMADKTNFFVALGFTEIQSRIMAAGELKCLELVEKEIDEEKQRNLYIRNQAIQATQPPDSIEEEEKQEDEQFDHSIETIQLELA